MKRKSVFIVGSAGVLILAIGVIKGLQSNDVSTKENAFIEQANMDDGDQYKIVTKEEQDQRENNHLNKRDSITTVTAEEQKMVENSSALEGFVSQEEGTGFFFKKTNNGYSVLE
ncbi:hypothetical protein [Rummeliibacillus suwonensis]|uniref:hypothetical protein n=1 Tax=Rummeliibacillus suwonensis TaxID=1306154 RepID=UPI0011B4C01B|nr:hypothetical protein [Rummeliibacillus suwonensis]